MDSVYVRISWFSSVWRRISHPQVRLPGLAPYGLNLIFLGTSRALLEPDHLYMSLED